MGLACMRAARLSSSRNPLSGAISPRLVAISPRLEAISPRLDFLFFVKSPARSNLASPRRNLALPGSHLASLGSHLASSGLSLLHEIPCAEQSRLAWKPSRSPGTFSSSPCLVACLPPLVAAVKSPKGIPELQPISI
ncbi:hypothetical protein ACLB2K_006292 [Fragaria x ananassa]